MAYNNAIPQPTDKISASQSQILNNFAALATAFQLNHGAFDGPTQGQHKWLQMPDNVAAPAAFNATDLGLLNAVSALTSGQELHLRRGIDATNGIPITAADKAFPGWTYLPSGLIVKWGSQSFSGSGTNTITYTAIDPTSAPFSTATLFVNATVYTSGVSTDVDAFVQPYAWNATTFSYRFGKRTASGSALAGARILYIAVGY